MHAGVARVLFPQATHRHHWAGSASVSNDVQLEPENTPRISGLPLGDPGIGNGYYEKNFPFAFSLKSGQRLRRSETKEEIGSGLRLSETKDAEQQFRQAIHKIHIHLLAMEKVPR